MVKAEPVEKPTQPVVTSSAPVAKVEPVKAEPKPVPAPAPELPKPEPVPAAAVTPAPASAPETEGRSLFDPKSDA